MAASAGFNRDEEQGSATVRDVAPGNVREKWVDAMRERNWCNFWNFAVRASLNL